MITSHLYTIPYLVLSVPMPSTSSQLSLISHLLYPLTYHVSIYLSVASPPIISVVCSPPFLSSLPSLSSALFGLLCLFFTPFLCLFPASSPPPPCQISSLYPLLFTYSLSVCFYLPPYLASFPVCFSVNRSALGLFTYSLSLLPQRYTNPLLSLGAA